MANGAAIKVINTGKAMSTPVSDKTPVKAQGSELEITLKGMEDAASAFARSIIKDPIARADYMKKTVAVRDELIKFVKDGKLTPHEAAKTATAIRNEIMDLTRAKLTDFGLALSKDMKKTGKTLQTLESEKAATLFNKSFDTLTAAEKGHVWVKIVESAGKSRPSVNTWSRVYGIGGRIFLVATLAFAVYEVVNAEDKKRQTAAEGVSIAGGVGGGALAGVGLAAIISNPAGWVVGVVIFVGAAVGAVGSSEAFNHFWPEMHH